RLTDGTVAKDGDFWKSDLTSIFSKPESAITWDLGRVVKIRAAYLQGDNNDDFFLAGSEDGKEFKPFWHARTIRGAGMRPRYDSNLDASARFVRLTARGGDDAVSATELALFETPPEGTPAFPTRVGKRPALPGENEALIFGIVTAIALLVHRWNHPGWARGLAIGAPLVLAYATYSAVEGAFPPEQPVVDMLRAVSAGVAAAAVLRLSFRPEDVMPRFVNGTLVAMAFLAMTTFYNMWQPQFEDVADGRHTWVHTWDMRVYFPTAKYFDELGFDGLYVASVAAYLEDSPGASERGVAGVEIRDLKTYDMTTVSHVMDDVKTIKNRFSPERWQAFKRDMSYFWKTMGSGGYLGSLRDHGGNATPAWIFAVNLMFAHAVATENVLLRAAWLDPLLLLLFFVVAYRTFGLRTALVCIVVYGASTFPWFGSNWAGSTLRNDWMVCVGLGACALRKDRPALGGALLAGAAMIRAFPALSVFFLTAPFLVWLADTANSEGKIPAPKRILEHARPLFVPVGAAAACVFSLVILSTLKFGFHHSWGDWAHKIALHSVTPNVNHVGLRTLFQFDSGKTLRALANTNLDWAVEQVHTLASRRPFFYLTVGIYTILGLAAARGRDLRQAALIGMMMIPIYFYPSNYYLHYVFVLPLLVDYSEEPGERGLWGLVSVVVLLICVSEYFGFEGVNVDERYAQWSWGALIGYTVIFAALARDAWTKKTAAPAADVPSEIPAEPAPAP
ncbi:MAG TPA: hypothetical protein VHE30_18880, partial [Polyangiaceae bacterium]|nr:hypothetical protein [Polyangiaceae bacterium]